MPVPKIAVANPDGIVLATVIAPVDPVVTVIPDPAMM
jgi:hypothetical protein